MWDGTRAHVPPLFAAPCAAIARLLIEARAEVNTTITHKHDDKLETWTALRMAKQKQLADVVDVLLQNGAVEQ